MRGQGSLKKKKRGQVEESLRNLFLGWKNATESQSHREKKRRAASAGWRSCRLCGCVAAKQRRSQREKRKTESAWRPKRRSELARCSRFPLCPTQRAATKSQARRRRASRELSKQVRLSSKRSDLFKSLCLCDSVAFFQTLRNIFCGDLSGTRSLLF